MKIDLKDRKILLELDINSRQSLQSIGKKVGLSKEVVNYRLNKLTESGIISGFFTRIDTSKLEVLIFRTFIRTYNLTPEKEKDLIDFIVSNKKVGWCVKVDGNWNINFIYWADNVTDFSKFWRKLLAKYGDFIESKETSIFDRYIQFPKTFILPEQTPQEMPSFICGRNKAVEIDTKDEKILSIIASNSRINTLEISKKIGLTPRAIKQRIKKLKEKGIILGYGISLGTRELGLQYFKINMNFKRFDQKRFDEIIGFSKYHPNVIYTNELIGGADLELDVYAKNREELQNLLNEYRYKFSDLLKTTEILQYFEEFKHNLYPRKT